MEDNVKFETEDDGFLLEGRRMNAITISSWETSRKGVLRKIFSKLWELYISANTKSLTAALLLLVVIGINIALFFVAVLTHPVQVDYSLRAFEVTGHPAYKKLESLIAAKEDMAKAYKEDRAKNGKRGKRSATNPEVVIHSQYKQKWKLDLVYLARDDNIFTDDKLKYIHTIEKNLMKHPKFQDFCWKGKEVLKDKILAENLKGCMPPNSLIDYFYRTDYFDGQGISLSNVQETLDYLLTKVSTFWYVDEKFGADRRKSKFLRSQLNFGIPLKGYSEDEHSLEEQHEIFRKFLVKFVEQLGSSSSDQVTVLYGSSEIYDYEIKHTFLHDVLLAAVSFGLIVLLLFILTSFSLWLTIFGVFTIVFSFPFSYFVYRVLLRINTVGILTGTTAFVIIGIGVDDVFVFINVFRQAKHLKCIRERMKHLILTAGKATFFTSFTTAAAFGANALTKVPAVHDFGLFTCILVMSCWLMVVLLMPPALFLWQKWLIKCEMCLCLNSCCPKFAIDSQLDSLVNNDELESNQNAREMREMNPGRNLPTAGDIHEGANEPAQNASIRCCTVTNILTRFMNKFIANPVIRFRHSILVLFLIITGLSILAITHLKTASGRPQLFPSDSNLQKLLNLQFNFSYVDCSSCTGHLQLVHSRSPRQVDGLESFRSPVRRSIEDSFFFANKSIWINGSSEQNFSHEYGSNFTSTKMVLTTITTFAAEKTNNLTGVNEELPLTAVTNFPKTTASMPTNFTKSKGISKAKSPTVVTLTSKKNRNTITQNVSSPKKAKALSSYKANITALASTSSPTVAASTNAKKSSVAHVNTVANTANFTTSKPQIIKTSLKTESNEKITHQVPEQTTQPTAKSITTENKRKAKKTSTPSATSPTTPPLCPKPCTPVKRPIVDTTAIVFLVFGIKGVDQTAVTGKHFFGTEMGKPIYDDRFTMVGDQLQVAATGALVKAFCKICLAFQNNTELVEVGGADCFPRQVYRQLKLFKYEECQMLTEPHYANGRQSLSMVGVIHNEIKWMAMSFESSTYKGKSAFNVFQDFEKWENFTRKVLSDPEIPEMLKDGFQTSEAWVNMFSEMIAVHGAIYGITLSLVMCLAAVVIFTGNFKLSAIVFMTIAGALCLVVAIFWVAGWTLGAIEAISLSILVGTSVDYTVHLTEGYIMANRIVSFDGMSKKEIRSGHTRMALNHIGVSIFSSAITTLIAAIPLCLTRIRLFAKFGQILAINTTMSILYTLTICVSFLSLVGPTRFRGSFRSHFVAFVTVAIVIGIVLLVLYLLSVYAGVSVPGPTGGQLFK